MIAPAHGHVGGLSAALAVTLGPLIDVTLHDAVTMRAAKLIAEKHRDHYLMFGSAWNGVGTRLKAAAIHGAAYRLLFEQEPASPHDVRFEQDMRLFDGIANAAAAAENALLASYLLAVFPAVPEPADRALRQSRADFCKRVTEVERTEALGMALTASFEEEAARAMYELRDFLLHRGRHSRNHWIGGEFDGLITIASNPKAHASAWQNDLVINRDSLDSALDWASRHCSSAAQLLAAAM